MSDSLQPHELQHRPPCPSPIPGVHPNPCPSSWWCHATISSSVIPFSSCPQSFPASGSFPMSQLCASGGQGIGVSASTSVLPSEHPGMIFFRMDWLDFLAVQGILFFQFSSVSQSCLTLCDPINCSTPGLPVYHQLPESTQTHVHWVGDAIQPSHTYIHIFIWCSDSHYLC